MEFLVLLLLGGAFGIAVGSQLSRQPPQITVVQVQPDDRSGGSGGCAPLIFGGLIFLLLSWLISIVPAT